MRTRRCPLSIVVAAGLAICSIAQAQPAPDPSREIEVKVDSGRIPNIAGAPLLGGEAVLAWSQDITVQGAPWMRVHFGEGTLLAGPDRHRGGSYLVVTSAHDGDKHYLDAATLPEWDNISAFMNGETVLVELFTVPGMGDNRVVINRLTAGEVPPGGIDTICGNTDDRVPYNDPRAGRLSTGCTGWLISTNGTANEFLTAGHCISNGQTGAVMMFNVPPSTSTGGSVAPPAAFQFPVQSASIQSLDGGVGNDYARFNTNNNSNTGLPARIAQGRNAYVLNGSAPASGTAATTVRGYGVVNAQSGIPSVPSQWNVIGKTHTAPYSGRSGNRINYLTDTTGGNSGSPVTQNFLLIGERAIGIHTHGFCPGTFNSGTAIDTPGLQNALNSPSGVAFPYDTAVSKFLGTTMTSNNGGNDGGSIFFDVTTGIRSIEVTHFNLNVNRDGATNNATTTEDDDFFNFEVFITPGTAQGKETNQALWTKVADGSGMPRPEDEVTHGALRNTFTLNGSQSYGVAIVFNNGAGHAYTNATGSNETYSNADLSITGISASNTAFGTNIAGRVFNGGIGYLLNQSSGQCAETLFAQNNNGSNGGMVFFNVAVGNQPVTITALTTNVEGTGGLNCNLTIFRTPTTHVGKETNPALWTQVATASGASSPIDTPSSFALSSPITLNANSLHGFAIQLNTSGVAEAHAYTNGTGLNQTYSNGRLTITTGAASNTPFGTPFSPRVWNGSLCYGLGLNVCANSLFAQSPPNPSFGGFNSVPGGQEEADNFTATQNLNLTGATFWGNYSSSATPPPAQNFVVRIFSNSGGVPGALLATRNVNNVTPIDTGLFMAGGFNKPIYQYNMNFAGVALPPGQYWVSALGNTTGYTWAWARTNNTVNAHAVRTGTGAWALSGGDFAFTLCGTATPVSCYANCDGSSIPPILNVNDFVCFQQRFAAGDPYANCDGSSIPPVLNVNDFVCFQQRFAAGCP